MSCNVVDVDDAYRQQHDYMSVKHESPTQVLRDLPIAHLHDVIVTSIDHDDFINEPLNFDASQSRG